MPWLSAEPMVPSVSAVAGPSYALPGAALPARATPRRSQGSSHGGTAAAAAVVGLLAGWARPAKRATRSERIRRLATQEELESQLRAAVSSEDYIEAARLRDELQQLTLDKEAAVLCANREFYEAFRTCQIERMSSLWLDSTRSCCVHPAGKPQFGHAAVVESWAQIFQRVRTMEIESLRPSVSICGGVGRVVCFERLGGRGPVLCAVNLFESTSNGWKLSFHQAGAIADPPDL